MVGKIHEAMKPLNIMLIIPEMSTGGAQRSLANLSLELATKGKVYLVVFNREQPVAYQHGGKLISLEVYPGKGLWGKAMAFRQRVRALRSLKKELQISVSISFLEGADYVNVLSKHNEKVILSIRGSKLHDEVMQRYFFGLRKNILIPWMYKKADAIVAVNQGIAKELVDHLGLRHVPISVINNFYDFDKIQKLAQDPKEEKIAEAYRNPVIITTGRLAPEKRLHFMIRIFAELKMIKKNARLVFVGDGPEMISLKTLCDSLKLTHTTGNAGLLSDILFLGNQENVFKYLNGSAVYIMNSSSEGFPNGLVEAMICNIPVISSDCHYGPREIIVANVADEEVLTEPLFSDCGVLMPLKNDDPKIWVNAILKILNSNEYRERLITNGRKRVAEFNSKKALDKWMALLMS
jgi:glycosyltransferase involved in cell wall biosynthesis